MTSNLFKPSMMSTSINWFLFFVCTVAVEGFQFHINPTTVGPFPEEGESSFSIWVQDNATELSEAHVEITSITPNHVVVDRNVYILYEDQLENGTNITVKVAGLEFGHGRLLVRVVGYLNGTNMTKSMGEVVKVRVARKQRVIDHIFLVLIYIFMTLNNINMGCIMDMQVVREVFRKPIGPLVGFCSQFLFMPLAAYGFSFAFFTNSYTRLGLFALGCCPGGTGSNFWTLLLDGDVNLSVVMTFVSTVAALGMMPLWLFTLGHEFFEDIHIPYLNLFITLLALILPVGVGIIIRHCKPGWAKWSEKIIRPYTVVILVFFMTIGVYCNLPLMRLFTWQIIMAGLCVAWGGYMFGALAAWLFCMDKEQIIAISIETALQNPGIAFVLLQISLPTPDSDLACVSPIAQLFVTGVPLWVAYVAMRVHKKYTLSPNPKKISFRSVFTKQKSLESDVEELSEKKPQPSELWISVPIQEEDEQMIRAFGENEDDVVWQRS